MCVREHSDENRTGVPYKRNRSHHKKIRTKSRKSQEELGGKKRQMVKRQQGGGVVRLGKKKTIKGTEK